MKHGSYANGHHFASDIAKKNEHFHPPYPRNQIFKKLKFVSNLEINYTDFRNHLQKFYIVLSRKIFVKIILVFCNMILGSKKLKNARTFCREYFKIRAFKIWLLGARGAGKCSYFLS